MLNSLTMIEISYYICVIYDLNFRHYFKWVLLTLHRYRNYITDFRVLKLHNFTQVNFLSTHLVHEYCHLRYKKCAHKYKMEVLQMCVEN